MAEIKCPKVPIKTVASNSKRKKELFPTLGLALDKFVAPVLCFSIILMLSKLNSVNASPLKPVIVVRSFNFSDDSSTSEAKYSASSDDDAEYNPNDASNGNYDFDEFIQYPIVTVNFVPSLVYKSISENITAIQNVPIAKIRANIVLNQPRTNIDATNQTRSHLLQQLLERPQNNYDDQFTIEYHQLNHLNLFAIGKTSGEVFLIQKLSNYTYILDTKVHIISKSESPLSFIDAQPYRFEPKFPIIVEVTDVNNNEPESVKNLLSCLAYDNIDTETSICTAPFKDADRGINAELTYSISSVDESEGKTSNLRIDPKTGSIYRRYANVAFNQTELGEIITATDSGLPYLETSVRAKITILSSNKTIKRGFNEKPYIPDQHLRNKIILTGTEEPGSSISNLTPLDADSDVPAMHIVAGDPSALFAIDDGSLVVAKNIDFSEKKMINLTLMLTDGAEKNYLNVSVLVPKIVKSIPNKIHNTSISMSSTGVAKEHSNLIDMSRYAYDTSYAKYKLYSASSPEALSAFEIDEYSGIVRLARRINYEFNGRHVLLISIEDNRLSRDNYRSFVELAVNVNLITPPKPTTTTSTTTTTTTTTTTSTTTTTTTTTTPSPTTTTTTTSPPPQTPAPPPPSTTTQEPTTTVVTTFAPTSVRLSTSAPSSTTSSIRPFLYSTSIPTQNQPTNHERPYIHPMAPGADDPYTRFNPFAPYLPQPPQQQPPPFLQQPPQLPPQYPQPPPMRPPVPAYPLPPISSESQTFVKTLTRIVLGIMAFLFVLACTCLMCRCCCRTPRSKRYRDKNGALLNRSSFNSQQRLHAHHHGQLSNPNSMSRNMNSRLSLRTTNHGIPSSTRALHSKYNAGDSVSLSAMNERSNKHKPVILPPSPAGTHNSVLTHEGDNDLYANAFGPGHPQYLNELRRLKPDFTRMSARLQGNRKPGSTTNVSGLRTIDNRIQSKSSSALPSTPVRTSSHSASQNRSRVVASNQNRQVPAHRSSNRNRSSDLNESRTTNTSTNVSPSLNDNNSRTVLLGSDDIRTPTHIRREYNSRGRRQRSAHVHTDSTADYDDVASHSTLDDTTPQTSSENASMSEVPFDARFKTFVKQKKVNKTSADSIVANNVVACAHTTAQTVLPDHYDRQLPPEPSGGESENETTANLLSEHYADVLPVKSNNLDSTPFAGKGIDNNNHRASRDMNETGPHQNGGSHAVACDKGSVENGATDDTDDEQQQQEDMLRAKRQQQQQLNGEENEEDIDSDESADEDEEDAEEGVYDLGTSNLLK